MYALNVSIIYNPFSPIMNSFLSIKYVVDKQSIYDLAGMEVVDEIYGYTILQNKYNLPIAFIVDDAMRDWKPSVYIDPMKAHNSLLNAAVGYEANAYETIPMKFELCENAMLQHNDNWSYQYYSRIDETNPVKFNFIYEINESGYYFFTHGFKRGNLTVKIDDIVKDYDIADQMTSLGYIEKGSIVNLEIVEESVAKGVWGINFFTLNEDAFTRCYEMLIDNSVEIISASDTKIKCKVDAPNYGILYTSIPDDGGWTVKCNGKKIETFRIGDCLLAIDLPEGENIVEFKYHVPGLRIGLIISLISIVIFIILIIKGKFIIKRMMI